MSVFISLSERVHTSQISRDRSVSDPGGLVLTRTNTLARVQADPCFLAQPRRSLVVLLFLSTSEVRHGQQGFQGVIEPFAPWGLESEVTFAHDIPYEQVREFY